MKKNEMTTKEKKNLYLVIVTRFEWEDTQEGILGIFSSKEEAEVAAKEASAKIIKEGEDKNRWMWSINITPLKLDYMYNVGVIKKDYCGSISEELDADIYL